MSLNLMANDPDSPKLAGLDYQVVQTLGTGAGSTILLIREKKGGRRFAMKVVKRLSADDDIYIAQSRHEFEVAQKLKHPNILRIFDCRTRRSLFKVTGVELLMEYVPGKTLDHLPDQDIGRLVLIFMAVAAALEHMHRRGVFHGDLKPSNVMLSDDGEVKVIDLGTAWLKGHDKSRVQGTPQYMAPEQASERVVNAKTDLFNLGAMMYRLVTGQYANLTAPLEMEGLVGKRLNQVTPPMQLNPRVPGTLNETIMRCLSSGPEERPAGAFEVKNQLAASARYLGVSPEDLRVPVAEGG